MTAAPPDFNFDNSFARSLEGFYVTIQGHNAPQPALVKINKVLAEELKLDPNFLASKDGVEILSGKSAPSGAQPLAQAYAGHQFGGFSPSLGDGRAMLLGEIVDTRGRGRDIQLKRSGRTPFSRGGDGKAALGPVIREYIVGEAMHALGIPTTRSLAAVTTGEMVHREGPLPRAVLTRVADSHLRVGTFQFFAARNEDAKVKQLADYAIERHYPNLKGEHKYLDFLKSVIDRQAELVARWMSVGFVHRVMNTDNTTIFGETIDYGPCAFQDNYSENAVFSSIDEMGRYAYRMQPLILQWNLARLAECLLQLIDADDKDNAVRLATDAINNVPEIYEKHWLAFMAAKIGLAQAGPRNKQKIEELLRLMEEAGADFSLTFRNLAGAVEKDTPEFLQNFSEPVLPAISDWLKDWRKQVQPDAEKSEARMNQANPLYIARNHLVEEAIAEAVNSANFDPFHKLVTVLETPFQKQTDAEKFESGPPEDFGPFITYCGT